MHAQSIDRAGEPPLSLFNYSRDNFVGSQVEITILDRNQTKVSGKAKKIDTSGILMELENEESFIPVTAIAQVMSLEVQ